jgi:hypothetical protein
MTQMTPTNNLDEGWATVKEIPAMWSLVTEADLPYVELSPFAVCAA